MSHYWVSDLFEALKDESDIPMWYITFNQYHVSDYKYIGIIIWNSSTSEPDAEPQWVNHDTFIELRGTCNYYGPLPITLQSKYGYVSVWEEQGLRKIKRFICDIKNYEMSPEIEISVRKTYIGYDYDQIGSVTAVKILYMDGGT